MAASERRINQLKSSKEELNRYSMRLVHDCTNSIVAVHCRAIEQCDEVICAGVLAASKPMGLSWSGSCRLIKISELGAAGTHQLAGGKAAGSLQRWFGPGLEASARRRGCQT